MLNFGLIVLAALANDAPTAAERPERPREGHVWRVVGGPELATEQINEVYRSGKSFTEAALPVGYPPPTAPGAIEIKHYPSVRRAQVSGSPGQQASSRAGFWPLFQHIQRNDIAMTAPVEMIYNGMTDASSEAAMDKDAMPSHVLDEDEGWTMSFLYRSVENGPTGQDGNVEIIDAEPVTVLAIGIRGWLGQNTIDRSIETLTDWIESSDAWEIAGDVRTFGYNGPSVPNRIKWWEVQIPIRPAGE